MKKSFIVVNTLCLYVNEHQVCASLFSFLPLCVKHLSRHPLPVSLFSGENIGVLLPCASPCSQLCCLMSSRLSLVHGCCPCSTPGSREFGGGSGEELKNLIGLAPSLAGPSQSLLGDLGSALGQDSGGDRLRLRVLHSKARMIFKISEVCIRYLEFTVGKIKPFT